MTILRRFRRWLFRVLMTCRQCGHHVELHSHYRPGSNCAAPGCTCQRFR